MGFLAPRLVAFPAQEPREIIGLFAQGLVELGSLTLRQAQGFAQF